MRVVSLFLCAVSTVGLSGCVMLTEYQSLQQTCDEKDRKLQDLVTELDQIRKEKAAADDVLQRTQQQSRSDQETMGLTVKEIKGSLSSIEEDLRRCQSEKEDLETRLKQQEQIFGREKGEFTAKGSAAATRATEAEEQVRTLRGDLDDLNRRLLELQDARAQDARVLDAMKTKIEGDLKKWIADGKVAVALDEEGLRITLMDAVGIEEDGRARVRVEAYDMLYEISSSLLAYPEKSLYVIGHTDSVPIQSPQYSTNWELSVARAVQVVHYLQDEEKMDPKRLIAAGCGPHRPVADNANAEGRQKNRRVEILLPRICR